VFSHFWLATPQEVLQADWQEVWHSPQPPFLTVSVIFLVSIVLILLILKLLLKYNYLHLQILSHQTVYVNKIFVFFFGVLRFSVKSGII